MKRFYALAKEHHGSVDSIWTQYLALFQRDTVGALKSRVLLGHLLTSQAFVTIPDCHTHNYQWTIEKNRELLGILLSKYTEKTQAILDTSPRPTTTPNIRFVCSATICFVKAHT